MSIRQLAEADEGQARRERSDVGVMQASALDGIADGADEQRRGKRGVRQEKSGLLAFQRVRYGFGASENRAARRAHERGAAARSDVGDPRGARVLFVES